NLPERSARNAAVARRSSTQEALDDISTRRAALGEAEAELERSLRELDARSSDLAGRLQRTMVVREAEALMAEQRSTQARRSEVGGEGLALLEEEETRDVEREAREGELGGATAAVDTATAALIAAEAVVDEQGDELGRRREEAAASLPADLLARYEALRPRFDGVAVARLDGARCTGCHLTLSTTALERI